jgi:4-hydroxy-3-polyprenylbenzoate decarboxylase
MAYHNLTNFIETLEKAGLLVRIKEFINPHLEVSEITDRISKSDGMSLLFENNGTSFPILMNAMGSEKSICLALGVTDLDEPGRDIEKLIKEVTSPKEGFFDKLSMLPTLKKFASWMPKSIKGKGECQQVIMDKPDLSKLPIITCWPCDGGPFITLPVVHTKDPNNGNRNVGMYRMQVFGSDLTGMHWHLHKNSARHFREYKAIGKKMPVTVTLGGDPVYTYVATAPLPDNVDEYILAGFLRKKKVEMIKCLTNDLEVPSDVDFVIEGYVDPQEDLIFEGPFGDHTGFYSLADYYPRFHVTCITHRKNAVYPATIVGIPPQEDKWLGKATERIFLTPIRMAMLPEIVDMYMPAEGVFHNVAIVSIRNEFEGQAAKVMNALWGAGQMMFNKVMIVTNENVNIQDSTAVLDCIAKNVSIDRDIYFSKGPADVLDHSSERFAFGGKMGIDATHPVTVPDLNIKKDYNSIKKNIPELMGISTILIDKGIPLLILFIDKRSKESIRNIHSKICHMEITQELRFIVYCDPECETLDLASILWVVANHIDPTRDCFIEKSQNRKSCLGIDGTRKNLSTDGFKRDWPNPVVMNNETINAIDQKWDKLGLGPFIPSPSLKYKLLMKGNKAIAEE